MAEFKLKAGYNIRLAGSPDHEIVDAPYAKSVAIKPVEFRGIKPRLSVEEGDAVKLGSPLFHAKNNEDHLFTSPAGGKVVAINRGHRRVITSIVIQVDENEEAETFPDYEMEQLRAVDRQELMALLTRSGMLPIFQQRPFGLTADPTVTPRDIFVTAFDSAPLAPDTAVYCEGQETFLKAGLLAATRLTDGKVHLSLDGNSDNLKPFHMDDTEINVHTFTGPHPSGNVGVQIHHIAPIRNRNDKVWTANVQGIIALGKFLLQGRVPTERFVAVAGTGATNRKIFRTRLGVGIDNLVGQDVVDGDVRYISGNVLAGRKESATGFVGLNDHLVSIIPEATDPEFIGWMLPGQKKESFFRTFASRMIPNKTFTKDTRLGGGHRALVASGYYEQVTPMDLYPVYLIKSIMSEDFEEMEGLGIYEVVEEDLALCDYICPSKTEFQATLRDGLDLVYKEG